MDENQLKRTKKSWTMMKQRCYNTNAPDYDYYGGRGIRVCSRWLESFDLFFEDMGLRPEGLTLDRVDVNGNYEPSNCKWSTAKEQRNNQRIQTEARCDSSTGIRGVSKEKYYQRFKVEVKVQGIRYVLYRGPDFFEACCARKSFENQRDSL